MTVCAATLQSGNKPAAHAAMLPGIVHNQQMLHHGRLQDAHTPAEKQDICLLPQPVYTVLTGSVALMSTQTVARSAGWTS